MHVNSAAYAKFVTASHAATIATPTAESKFQDRIARAPPERMLTLLACNVNATRRS
jgi:hypothetical protein